MSRTRRLLSLLLILALFALPNSGCYDLIELENMAFVVALGLDKLDEDGMIEVTARIAVPSEFTGEGGGSNGPTGGTKPITVKAHSIPEALTLLNSTVERRISLLHLASIYLGESVARDGVVAYLRPFTRIRETRRTINLYVVPGQARDVFVLNKPVLEKSIARWQESLSEVNQHTGLSVTQRLHDFVVASESPLEDPIAPIVAVNDRMRQGKDMSEEEFAEAGVTFRPGEVARRGGNALEFMGTAVFRKDELVTVLDGIDTRLLLMIRGQLRRTQMDFSDPLEKGRYVGIELKHARAPLVEVDLSVKPIRVRIREKLEGDLMSAQGSTDYTDPENSALLEAAVSKRLEQKQKALMERIFHQYQADPFGLFKRNRYVFATMQEIDSFDMRQVLKKAQVDIDVEVELRRIGVQYAPVEAK